MAHMLLIRLLRVVISFPFATSLSNQMSHIIGRKLSSELFGMNPSGLRSPKNPARCPVARCPFPCRSLPPPLHRLPRSDQTAQTFWGRRGLVQEVIQVGMGMGKGMNKVVSTILVILMMIGMLMVIFRCTQVLARDLKA
jgi:hypothetical protein